MNRALIAALGLVLLVLTSTAAASEEDGGNWYALACHTSTTIFTKSGDSRLHPTASPGTIPPGPPRFLPP